MKRYIYILLPMLMLTALTVAAQPDKRDVRMGNWNYRKGDYKEAEIEYLKAIVKDSLSIAANYNLASDLYRQGKTQEARKVLNNIKEQATESKYAADYFYNLGDVAMAGQDWQAAVDAFAESLLRNPGDLDAKENYIYAKKMLEQQQNQQDNQNNQNNQDQQDNQDNQNNQDQQDNQDNQNNQDQQDNQDGQNDQNNQDNQDNRDNQGQQNPGQQPKITPQAAQQMLQAIQAKEKETQDKVKKEKAMALKSMQKEKNW